MSIPAQEDITIMKMLYGNAFFQALIINPDGSTGVSFAQSEIFLHQHKFYRLTRFTEF
jgi:hypothetical protein